MFDQDTANDRAVFLLTRYTLRAFYSGLIRKENFQEPWRNVRVRLSKWMGLQFPTED